MPIVTKVSITSVDIKAAIMEYVARQTGMEAVDVALDIVPAHDCMGRPIGYGASATVTVRQRTEAALKGAT